MEVIPADLTCSVCMEVYGNENLPICLPECGHSFCHMCLLDLAKHCGDVFPCPTCRFEYRSVAVNMLMVNYALLKVANKFSEKPNTMKPPVDLLCSMCMDVIGHANPPITLPKCGHSFCRLCLLDLAKHCGNEFPCPSCRFVYRSVVLNKVKVNYALLNVAIQLQNTDQPISGSQSCHEQSTELVTPLNSRNEEDLLDQSSRVKSQRIKRRMKKLLMKGISGIAYAFD